MTLLPAYFPIQAVAKACYDQRHTRCTKLNRACECHQRATAKPVPRTASGLMQSIEARREQ